MSSLTWADLNGACRPAGGEQLVFQVCPLCGDGGEHFYINRHTGGYDCKKCGAAGYVKDGAPHVDEGLFSREEPRADSDDRHPEVELPSRQHLGAEARAYVERRGIEPMWLENAASACDWPERERIIFPFFDPEDRIIYWVARSYAGAEPRYLNAPGRHLLYQLPGVEGRSTVIVEGIFDALRVRQAGFSAVALLGKSLARHLWPDMRALLAQVPRIYIMLDGDALPDAMKLQGLLQGWGADAQLRCLWGTAKDPGDMTPEEILALINRKD